MFGGWEAVVGLEIHAQVNTKSKIFSPDSASFGAGDNNSIHPVSMGLPGALPTLNENVVKSAVKAGLALNCEIQKESVFSRKNYFYPDMPKGYQISQFDKPICKNGKVEFYVNGEIRQVRVERIHMEEDAGKSTHFGNYTLINLNRAGVPLLEIVSEPDMRSPQEAAEYSRAVRQTLRYIGICDGNLEEGSLRVDCNVSVRKPGDPLGEKVELKNLNSFRFIEKAVEYEIQRQIDSIESGKKIIQETRLYDSVKNMTTGMRLKEDAHDYRYFPEPDLPVCRVEDKTISEIRKELPELPMQRVKRYEDSLGIPRDDAVILTSEKELSSFFEEVVSVCNDAKTACNWIRSELLGYLNDQKISLMQPDVVTAEQMGELINCINSGEISGKIAKKVFKEMCQTGSAPEHIIRKNGYKQITDKNEILKIAKSVFEDHPKQAEQLLSGKEKVFGFFVGQVMQRTGGQAAPDIVNEVLRSEVQRRSSD